MKVVLIVGHSEESQGASNSNGMTEFIYNTEQCKRAVDKLIIAGHTVATVYRDDYAGLPHKVNLLRPDLIVSFHCNAFNKRTSGCEVLHYRDSIHGKQFAKILQRKTLKAIPVLNRGLKPVNVGDRGGLLLRNTKAPCVIWEPFFIDNDSDLEQGIKCRDELIDGLVEAVNEYAE